MKALLRPDSEFLGRDEGDDQIDAQGERHDQAKNRFKHDGLRLCAKVQDRQPSSRSAQGQVQQTKHPTWLSPSSCVGRCHGHTLRFDTEDDDAV
jgi:hypothetical protein